MDYKVLARDAGRIAAAARELEKEVLQLAEGYSDAPAASIRHYLRTITERAAAMYMCLGAIERDYKAEQAEKVKV